MDKDGNLKKKQNEENDFYNILEKEGLLKYKNFFNLSFDDISNMINNYGFNNYLLQD